jgi:predicted ATPase/Tfp pilus assembly protein PilF
MEQLSEAASLYHGDFASGFSLADASTFESWLLLQRESSQQEMILALENLANAAEISGEYEEAISYANQQLMMEPWRENAYRQLMRALVQDGRRTEALAQFEACRQALWEELEIEPAAETQKLLEAIKEGTFVPSETKTRTQLHHFPTQFTPFIGRESILSEIVENLTEESCRLLTVVGPGGIGKTRVTIKAARQLAEAGHFKDGIFFVPLAAISEGDYFLMALASQMEVSIYGRNRLQDHLQSSLTNQDILLVLDNFEQLAAESNLLSDLLTATARLKILVSSRVALNIQAEQRLAIDGMTNDEAVNLFLEATGKVWPAYKPKGEEMASIQEVCRLVTGIPLAVEMAAGWVRSLPAAQIAHQIRTDYAILKAPYLELPERHQSMRYVFESSWNLLNPAEQTALAQFSIFKGGFSLYAILANTDATINEVAALLDKSLLAYPGKSRYQLHELLRQFAQSKLSEVSQDAAREKLEQQFAEYYIDLLHRSEGYLYGLAPQIGMAEVDAEYDNILKAWQLAIENEQLPLVEKGLDGLQMYFRLSGRFQEATRLFQTTIETISKQKGSALRDKLHCHLLIVAADFSMQSGELDLAEEYIQQALVICTREQWPDIEAGVNKATGDLNYEIGKFIKANGYLQKAITYYESVGNKRKLVESYYKLGICFWRSERWQDAAEILTKALNIAQSLEYNWAVVICLWALGYLYRHNGRRDLSLDYYQKSIQLALDINFLPGVHRGYVSSGLIYEDLGQNEKAMECYRLSVQYAREIGDQMSISRSNGCISRVLWRLGRLQEALELMEESLLISQELGYKVHIAWQLIVKAEILYALGRHKDAWPVNEEGLKLARETTLADRILQAQILKARLLVALEKTDEALNLLKEMLETAEDPFTKADASYELWRITKEPTHARAAHTNYIQAYQKDPYFEYNRRIEELTQIVQG